MEWMNVFWAFLVCVVGTSVFLALVGDWGKMRQEPLTVVRNILLYSGCMTAIVGVTEWLT
jgi:hypothetical protein